MAASRERPTCLIRQRSKTSRPRTTGASAKSNTPRTGADEAPIARLKPIASILGGVLLAVGILVGGGPALIPGLFLLGFAIARSGFLRSVLTHPGRVALVGAGALVVTIIGFASTDYLTRQIHQPINAGLGIAMALTYVVIIVLLLRTPAEAAVRTIFSPLGRMALSNYLGATLILVGLRFIVPDLNSLDSQGGYLAGLIICVGIILVQVVVSSLWLRTFGQGPLEKLWRRVTWGSALAAFTSSRG